MSINLNESKGYVNVLMRNDLCVVKRTGYDRANNRFMSEPQQDDNEAQDSEKKPKLGLFKEHPVRKSVTVKHFVGGTETLTDRELEQNYVYIDGSKINTFFMKNNTRYVCMRKAAGKYVAIYISTNLSNELTKQAKYKSCKKGYYIVGQKNGNRVENLSILKPDIFKAMFSIPEQKGIHAKQVAKAIDNKFEKARKSNKVGLITAKQIRKTGYEIVGTGRHDGKIIAYECKSFKDNKTEFKSIEDTLALIKSRDITNADIGYDDDIFIYEYDSVDDLPSTDI